MWTYAIPFAVFLPRTKNFNVCVHTVAELIVSAVNNLKMMGGGHAVHEQQAILSTTVVISHTFCTTEENELTPTGAWQ